MKTLKLLLVIISLGCCQSTFSQEKSTALSIKNIDSKIEEGAYNDNGNECAEKLVMVSKRQSLIESLDSNWNTVWKEMQENKEKYASGSTSRKKRIHYKKTVDTIYLNIPELHNNHRSLSGSNW